MNIKKIYDISLYQCKQGNLTNSYIFAVGAFENKHELHPALIKGQTVANLAMLRFPVVVHLLAAGRQIENGGIKLFENVKFLEQGDWDIADESEIFLMNERKWRLCKGGDDLYDWTSAPQMSCAPCSKQRRLPWSPCNSHETQAVPKKLSRLQKQIILLRIRGITR